MLGLDDFGIGAVVLQAVAAAPLLALLPPGVQRGRVGPGRVFAQHGNQLREHFPGVAHDGHVGLDALGNAGRVHVNVDDLALLLREVFDVADHAVVKARAHGQQHIAMLHGVVGLQRAVHAHHAHKAPVGAGERAQPHQRGGHGHIEQVFQLAQLLAGIAQQHAAAHVNQRPPGRQKQLQRLADLPRVALAHGVVGAHLDRFRVARPERFVEGNVFRNVHQHRAGAACAGDVEGFFHHLGHLPHILDQKVVLDHGPRHAHGVALLEGVLPNERQRHLPADDHQRNRIHVSRGDARDGIGQAGAGRHQRHAHLARGARVAVSRVHGGLLMAREDVLDAVLLEQRVINVQNRAARVAKNLPDAFGLQGLDENFRTAQLLRRALGRVRRA